MSLKFTTGTKVLAGFAVGLAILAAIGWVSYQSNVRLDKLSRERNHVQEEYERLQELFSELQDAETGQRGFVITGDERFLEPYQDALQQIDQSLLNLHQSAADNPSLQRRLDTFDLLAARKLADLKQSVDMRRAEGLEAAAKVVSAGNGKSIMDAIREYMGEMKSEQAALINQRNLELQLTARNATSVILFGSILSFLVLGLATLVINRDLTHRLHVEEETLALNRDLQRRTLELTTVNKELEAFSYSVSHDLRAPLRSIDGFSQALLEDYKDKLDEEGKDFLNRVRAATQRMAQLIDDLINLSRVSRAEVHFEKVNLSALANSVAEALRTADPGRHVEFSITPDMVSEGDEPLVRIAMVNLIGNAWKFTSKRATARIEVGVLGRENGRQIYFVHDDGVGFEMKHAQKLFSPFHRLHSMTEFNGTGVGLATVKRIINRHGGRVWAESQADKGASFYFTL